MIPKPKSLVMPSNIAAAIYKNRRDSVEPDDPERVRRCRAGDTSAFNDLVTKYRNKVCNIVYGMVGNEQDALDLAQDGFLSAWRSIHSFAGRSSFHTWLYRIATNVTIDSLRRKRIDGAEFDDRTSPAKVDPRSRTTPWAPPLPRERLEQKEILQRIHEAITQLSPDHHAVIVMKELGDLQYNEIAEILGLSIGTVMSRLFYARKRLQTLLRDVYENL
ncbi:MAG: sigma-70 family RNA polymerase sigma factor [Chthoniobacterales bacterium]